MVVAMKIFNEIQNDCQPEVLHQLPKLVVGLPSLIRYLLSAYLHDYIAQLDSICLPWHVRAAQFTNWVDLHQRDI